MRVKRENSLVREENHNKCRRTQRKCRFGGEMWAGCVRRARGVFGAVPFLVCVKWWLHWFRRGFALPDAL